MVILLHCEMDEDGRRGKKSGLFERFFAGSRSSTAHHHKSTLNLHTTIPPERRPLRSVPLVGPHHLVEPEILATSFVEKETKFLGTIDDLPHDFDPNDRNLLLRIIDEKKTCQLMPWIPTYKQDIIVNYSVHNLKLVWRDGEELIHRIPTHHISAVGYLRDDDQHLVFIKFSSELNAKMCKVAVLCCDSTDSAEELCSLAQQLFQLVYTDSTIEFFNKQIEESAGTPKNNSYSTDDSVEAKVPQVVRETVVESQSIELATAATSNMQTPSMNLNGKKALQENMISKDRKTLPLQKSNERNSASSLVGTRRHHSESSSWPVVTHQYQLQDYLAVLKEKLNTTELKEFAELLHLFRTHKLSIQEYCQRLFKMYTEQRKMLLLGLRPFIPTADDMNYFESFLKEHDVYDVSSDDENRWYPVVTRTLSETEESSASTSVAGPQTTESEHRSTVTTGDELESVVERITLKDDTTITSASSILSASVSEPTERDSDSSNLTEVLSKEFQDPVKTQSRKPKKINGKDKKKSKKKLRQTEETTSSNIRKESTEATSSSQKEHRKKKRHKKSSENPPPETT